MKLKINHSKIYVEKIDCMETKLNATNYPLSERGNIRGIRKATYYKLTTSYSMVKTEKAVL